MNSMHRVMNEPKCYFIIDFVPKVFPQMINIHYCLLVSSSILKSIQMCSIWQYGDGHTLAQIRKFAVLREFREFGSENFSTIAMPFGSDQT